MGRAESDVVKHQENENYRKVYVQWWVHVKKKPKMMKNCNIIVG
jgi:hypothetical protein